MTKTRKATEVQESAIPQKNEGHVCIAILERLKAQYELYTRLVCSCISYVGQAEESDIGVKFIGFKAPPQLQESRSLLYCLSRP